MSLLIGASSPAQGASGAQGAAADLGDTIDQSLRFNNGPSTRVAYLQDSDITIQGTSTFSGWIKIGDEHGATKGPIFGASKDSTGGDNATALGLTDDGRFYSRNTGGDEFWDNRFRDFSAWYHVVLQFDSSRNMTLFVNGEQQLSTKSPINVGSEIIIGRNRTGAADEAFQGYMAALYYVDGSILAPTSFGKYNDSGVWVPQDYSGSYGTNGFKLTFDSSQTNGIGHDSSGQGNHFTAGGFESTAISSSNFDNDIDYFDTPTSNYPVLNPAAGRVQVTTSKANLTHTSSANFWQTAYATHGITTGKWYWECELTVKAASSDTIFGITNEVNMHDDSANGNYPGDDANGWGYYHHQGYKIHNGTFTLWGDAYGQGDIIAFAFDADTGTIWASKNGTWQNSATQSEIEAGTTTNSMFTGISADVFFPAVATSYPTGSNSINLGQRDFVYTAPSGYGKLQTNNLPEPTIKNGKEHFGVVTWTGNLTSRSITGLDFQPDFVWIKCRDTTFNHNLVDSVRGADKIVYADLPSQEVTSANLVTSFNSDGFSVSNNASSNNTGNDYVAWCWKAGGTAVSNTDGTITSSVSANTDAGFSIVSYTGTGSNATVGHGLTSAPEWIITKERDNTRNWGVYHTGSGNTNILFLNLNNAQSAAAEYWQNTDPTTSVFSIGTSTYVNNSSGNYIAYCWHSVEGFSKFGSYTGNGSADGPFVYTGMKVAWILIKGTNTNNWHIRDTTRHPDNPNDALIYANLTDSDASSAGFSIDMLSNGFKLRGSHSLLNTSGQSYIYMAFAENPFGGENAPPATAR